MQLQQVDIEILLRFKTNGFSELKTLDIFNFSYNILKMYDILLEHILSFVNIKLRPSAIDSSFSTNSSICVIYTQFDNVIITCHNNSYVYAKANKSHTKSHSKYTMNHLICNASKQDQHHSFVTLFSVLCVHVRMSMPALKWNHDSRQYYK